MLLFIYSIDPSNHHNDFASFFLLTSLLQIADIWKIGY